MPRAPPGTPYARGSTEIEVLRTTTLLLNPLLPQREGEVEEIRLSPGERLLAFTDGAYEVRDGGERSDLLIHHAGFVYRVRGKPRLLHASSYHGRVVLTPEDVVSYLLRRPERQGILVARP